MTPQAILIFSGCCVVASVTQSLSSFGFGVVLVGLLPILGVSIQDTVVLVTLLVLPNLAIALWRLRRQVSLRRIAWVLLGVPLGIPIGLYLLTRGPEWFLRGLLGTVLVIAALEPFLLRRPGPGRERRVWAIAAGLASGALGAALSTGGPPIVLYFYRRQRSKELTKASVMLTFVGTVLMRVVAYVVQAPFSGKVLITADLLATSAAFAPAVVAGTFAGEWLFHAISQTAFRRVVAAMLVACGLYHLAKAAGAW